ncbi:MAG: hypothetical protein AB7V22_07670 [Kiritimatiellia bacterium]
MKLQHEVYWEILPHLLDIAHRKIKTAEILLNVATVPGTILKYEDSFDHRVLQLTHDAIAASFRFERADQLHPQLPLFNKEDERTRVLRLWREYFIAEVNRLTEIPAFTSAVVSAVAFANTDEGNSAEDQLFEIAKQEYPFNESLRWVPPEDPPRKNN